MLWRRLTNALIEKELRLAKGAVLKVVNTDGTISTINIVELAALDAIGAADLAKIDGITNGTSAAGKAVVLGASGEIDTVAFGAITGADASLGITGQAAAQGGAIVITGGASSGGNNAGGASSVIGGAGNGTGAGGNVTLTGGASGAGATGDGGDVVLSGGAAASTNGNGGSVIFTPGAKNGSGIAGGTFLRSATGLNFRQQTAAGAGADQAEVLTAATMINGIFVHTISAGRTLTTPTGAQISAGCPADLAVGDSFDFSLITIGTGADDIVTLTAGDANVTFVGVVTVGPNIAGTDKASGTWRFRNTGANTWVGYRLA